MNHYSSLTVTAQAFDRTTGEPKCEPRAEVIDASNVLFSGCKTVLGIKKAYERFWNELNDYSDIVFVHRINIEWL